MNRNYIITIIVFLLVLHVSANVRAGDYERLERRNLWNVETNASGIRMDSVSISMAKISGSYTGGKFRDYSMPSSSWSVGAEAGTMIHLEKFSMKGAFSFNHLSGQQMCGSMSSRPGYYPVDVFEFTPGRKDMQTYAANGNIAADVGENFVIGAGIDYTARNYTKRKDLRHTSWMMEMTVNAGFVAKITPGFSLGLSYIFNKSSEKVVAEELGISSDSYYAFINKGMMFGVKDLWTGGGLHLKETGVSGFPIRENRHGVSLQLDGAGFHGEFNYIYGRGKAGEKNVIWFNFPSHSFNVRLGYAFKPAKVRHIFRLNASLKAMDNNENVIAKETEGGVTESVTYGSNLILRRRNIGGDLSYEAMASRWGVWAGLSVDNLVEQSTLVYPYSYIGNVLSGSFRCGGMAKMGPVTLEAELSYMQGRSSLAESVISGAPSVDLKPYRQMDLYNIDMEYRTAPRLGVDLEIRCDVWRWLYVGVAGTYTRAFNLRYIPGGDRLGGTLSIGYIF